MAKNKLDPANLHLRQPAARPSKPQPRAATKSAADFVEGDRPKRGRPRSLIEKKGVMMYVPEQLHEDFRTCAKHIEGRDMTEVLEELMKSYVDSHAKALATIRSVQTSSRKTAG